MSEDSLDQPDRNPTASRDGRVGVVAENVDRADVDRKVEEEALHEAHRLPASMSSSARRLRHERSDESSARIFAESTRYSAMSEQF